MEDCKLSIIVPVYNVEQTLVRCVDSLQKQDLLSEDYEVIMVNDGSKDNSRAVAERLVSKYENVLLVNQDNQGLSGARNTGIGLAKGKYQMFVDSDDYLAENCLGKLIEICEENRLDVCHFSLTSVRNSGNFRGSIGALKVGHLYSGYDVLLDGHLIGSACSNVYLTDFLTNWQLFFQSGLTHQDVEFSYRLYCHAKRVMIVGDEVYFYTFNPTSISKDRNNFDKENKYVCDAAIIGRLTKEYALTKVADNKIKDLLIRRVNTAVVANLYSLLRKPTRPAAIIDNLVDAYRENGLFPVTRKCLSWKSRIMGLLLFSSTVYKKLYHRKLRKYAP